MPKKITSDLEGVAALLKSKRQVPGGQYWLYALDKKIHLCRSNIAPQAGHRIALLESADINEGPTAKKWEVIDARIRKLKEEGKL